MLTPGGIHIKNRCVVDSISSILQNSTMENTNAVLICLIVAAGMHAASACVGEIHFNLNTCRVFKKIQVFFMEFVCFTPFFRTGIKLVL